MTIGRRSELLSLVGKMKNVLSRLGMRRIAVSDLSGQEWCEKQMELSHLHPKKPTVEMASGSAAHYEMQKRVYVSLEIEPRVYPDRMYKEGYEAYVNLAAMRSKGVCRELKIYGSVNAYEIAGKIDELKLEKGTVSIIDDKAVDAEKAGASDYVPRTYAVQLSLYRKLLSDIRSRRYNYENFASSRKLGSMPLSKEFEMALAEIGIRDSLMSIEGIYKKMFEELYALPEISSRLELRYIDNRSREHLKSIFIQYDEKQLTDVLRDCMKYWNGERDARPVPMKERWKCKRCRFFGNECKVWFEEEEGKVA